MGVLSRFGPAERLGLDEVRATEALNLILTLT